MANSESSFVEVKGEDNFENRDSNDLERASQGLLASGEEGDEIPIVVQQPVKSRGSAMLWMVINTLATIGIVSN